MSVGSSDRIRDLSDRIRSLIHRSTPKVASRREAMSSASSTRPKVSTTNDDPLARARSSGDAQSVHSRGIANEPRIGISEAQSLNTGDAPDLQNVEPFAAQGMKRVDDFSRSQRLVGEECSSTGAWGCRAADASHPPWEYMSYALAALCSDPT